MAESRESAANTPADVSVPALAGWPRPLHYLCGGCFFLTLAVYGSLVPLEYRSIGFSAAHKYFLQIFVTPASSFSRTDIAVNVALFVPVGFCFLAAFEPPSRSLVRIAFTAFAVLTVCVVTSIGIEFSQIWFARRTASAFDVYAQFVGAIIGMLLWVGLGRALSEWLRSRTAVQARIASLAGVLLAYFAGLTLYWMLPLDLTIRPAELWRKYQAGRVVLRPFSEFGSLADSVELLTHVAVFVPVGMLAVVLFTPHARPLRGWLGSLVLSCFLVLFVWCAGLIVVSRFTSSTQLIAGLLGSSIGIALVHWWLGELAFGTARDSASSPRHSRFAACIFGALCYTAVLVAIFCFPAGSGRRVIRNRHAIAERLHNIMRPPLASLYKGSIFNAAKEIVRKVGLFFPLGLVLAVGIADLSLPAGVRRAFFAGAILWGACVALGIELFQVILPGHTPDLTDAILCTIGATLGVTLGIVWRRAPRADG